MGVLSGDWEPGSFFLDGLVRFGQWELRPMGYYVIFFHVMGVLGLSYLIMGHVSWQHLLFVMSLGAIGGLGVAAGAHRLWSHRSYKAKLPLRMLLMFMHTLAGNGSVIRWVRDHRLHHKYSETNGDPHNIRRGFLFSHIGWAMLKEHPKVVEKTGSIDFSDLHVDPIVMFQYKYFALIEIVLVHTLPVLISHHIWQAPLHTCLCLNYFRLMLFYHIASVGNSVAHSLTRRKPYEKGIGSSDNSWLSLFLAGEGWHNYHHVFPWDYRSTDEGIYAFNLSTMFIDLMAKIGWAYDLKTASDRMVLERATRTGDGSWQRPVTEVEHFDSKARTTHETRNEPENNHSNRSDDDMKKTFGENEAHIQFNGRGNVSS